MAIYQVYQNIKHQAIDHLGRIGNYFHVSRYPKFLGGPDKWKQLVKR